MSQVKFIGCLHFGHEFVAFKRGFMSSVQHDDYLVKQWNSVVHKKDLVWILGDISMEKKEQYENLKLLNGRKKVVLGNHDLPKDVKELLKYVEEVAGMVDYKGFCLSHAPIHPNEVTYYRGNIHAHIHEGKLEECKVSYRRNEDCHAIDTLNRYFNVDAAAIDFKPRTIDELLDFYGYNKKDQKTSSETSSTKNQVTFDFDTENQAYSL